MQKMKFPYYRTFTVSSFDLKCMMDSNFEELKSETFKRWGTQVFFVFVIYTLTGLLLTDSFHAQVSIKFYRIYISFYSFEYILASYSHVLFPYKYNYVQFLVLLFSPPFFLLILHFFFNFLFNSLLQPPLS